jgi:hypothetical protein
MGTEMADAWIEFHVALGLVVTAGAKLEDTLRLCYCMLDGGENAEVIAAGQDVTWLRGYCGDLANANQGMDQASKDAITYALGHCRAASERRNELVHGLHRWLGYANPTAGRSGLIERSRRHKPALVKEWSISGIRDVWLELDEASERLHWAVSEAVGPRVAAHWANRLPNWVDEHGKPWPF